MKKILILLIGLWTLTLNANPQITGLTASQRNDHTKRIDIYYNLSHNRPVSITLLASYNNGVTWNFPCNLVTGDFGNNISPGNGKHIVWDVLSEHPNIVGNQYRFKIIADDGTGPPIPDYLVLVEGGIFNPTANYTVTVSSFYIGKYEVTQSEYEAVMGNNPSSFGGNPNRPVERVSWFNAIEYCNRLSISQGLMPVYTYSHHSSNPDNWPQGWNSSDGNHTRVFCDCDANGYRLPTEMEWMFAASGGIPAQNAGTFSTTYAGSNNISEVAWYSSNSGNRTHDVGTKAYNELGLYDMSGNVREWCWDIHGSYPSGSYTNPKGATSGSNRLLRGGSWYSSANYCEVTNRNYNYPTNIYSNVGFRIARTLE